MATIEKYENAQGKALYMVRYRTPENRQTKKRGFKTKRDAQIFANTVEVKKLTGDYVAPSLGKVTIGELGPDWLARVKGIMKPSSYRSCESNWRLHVEPRWGQVQIGKVKTSDVQAWVTSLAGSLSASHVIDIYSVLARILDDAVKDRLIATNYARGVSLPKRTKKPNVYLTADQLRQLAAQVAATAVIQLWRGNP